MSDDTLDPSEEGAETAAAADSGTADGEELEGDTEELTEDMADDDDDEDFDDDDEEA